MRADPQNTGQHPRNRPFGLQGLPLPSLDPARIPPSMRDLYARLYTMIRVAGLRIMASGGILGGISREPCGLAGSNMVGVSPKGFYAPKAEPHSSYHGSTVVSMAGSR
jgi:hypothetical protein